MLSFALVLGFLAAVNCAHITTVEDINALIDKTIAEISKEKEVQVTDFPGVLVVVLKNLKRHGDCEKATKVGVFECKALSEEAKVTAKGEHEEIVIRMTFEVTVDSEGHLVKYQVVKTEVDFIEEVATTDNYYGWIKKHLHHLKYVIVKTVEKAVHVVIQKEVADIVATIAASVLQ